MIYEWMGESFTCTSVNSPSMRKMALARPRDMGAFQHVMLHLIVHLSVLVVCTAIVEV